MDRFHFKILFATLLLFGSYTGALACSCDPSIRQDPSGSLAVGDPVRLSVNQTSDASCGITVQAGDTLEVWGELDPARRLAVNTCNSNLVLD